MANIVEFKNVYKSYGDKDILKAVILEDGERIEGDSFVDTTGSSGPMGNCTKYGNGCKYT